MKEHKSNVHNVPRDIITGAGHKDLDRNFHEAIGIHHTGKAAANSVLEESKRFVAKKERIL